jgi:carbonic anhydrase
MEERHGVGESVPVSEIILTYYQSILHTSCGAQNTKTEKDRKGNHALERLMSLTQTTRPHVGQLSEQYLGLKRRTRPTHTSQSKLRQGYSVRTSANPGPGS